MATIEEEKTIATSDETSNGQDENYVVSKLKVVRLILVQSSLGQKLFSFIDKVLWTVEKCAEWSLPAEEIVGEDGKIVPKPEYVRPLPWYLFLPSLVFIRSVRMSLNIAARIMNYPHITPARMVNIIKSNRRHINALRINGVKSKQVGNKSSTPSSQTSTLKREFSPSPSTDSTLKDTSQYDHSLTESEDSIVKSDEPLVQMIDRLAEENSNDDEDFALEDSTSATNDEDDSDDDDDEDAEEDNVSQGELNCIIEEANELLDHTNDEPSADRGSAKRDPNEDEVQRMSEEEIKQTSRKEAKRTPDEKIIQISKEIIDHIMEEVAAQTSEEAAKYVPEEDAGKIPGEQRRLSSEESRAKVDDRLTSSRSHDSLECYTPDRSSQEGDLTFYSPISSDSDTPKEHYPHSALSTPTADNIAKTNQFINGEIRFVSETMISESKPAQGTNNGVVAEKRGANVSKIHRGKRTSHGNRKKK